VAEAVDGGEGEDTKLDEHGAEAAVVTGQAADPGTGQKSADGGEPYQ
jgi:hypothetical protein